VKTTLGRRFLNIVDRHFPKNNPLHKIISHLVTQQKNCYQIDCNQSRNSTQTLDKECNCRKKDQCLLEGKCLASNVVYQAAVTTETPTDSYVGLATNFKERYRNHTSSFRHQNKRHETELSKHMWTLKDNKKPFNLKNHQAVQALQQHY